jgi:hypothetical protein
MMTIHMAGTREEWLAARLELLDVAKWPSLAAAPTFAIMALFTGVLGDARMDNLCSAAEHTSLLSGMIPMYLLMSAFHLTPWLSLVSRWRKGCRAKGMSHVATARIPNAGQMSPPAILTRWPNSSGATQEVAKRRHNLAKRPPRSL